MRETSIYQYIKAQEAAFETEEIQVGDNWMWNFRNHVQLIFHLKNGIFFTGQNNWLRAFKNIMEPIIELSMWTEDIEVKDVNFFIEGEYGRVLSFFIKKYYEEVFVRKYNLDKFFDDSTESDLTYGGALVQKTNTPCPEVLKLTRVAFCDQTDILGGPLGLKLSFAPDKLRSMKKNGWGDKKNGATISIEDLITLAEDTKSPAGNNGRENKTPGKVIEVYIVRGNLPEDFLKDNDNTDDWYNQVQVAAFYTDKKGQKEGVTLYRKKESESNLKMLISKEVEDRALGRGVGERLLHSQIWTNFLTIHKTAMLEAGSKVPLYTDDESYTQRNKIQDMENLEITTIQDGKRIYQVPTVAPANIQLYEKSINEWYSQAQLEGAAFDPLIGEKPVSGQTFRGQERIVEQGKGPHNRRRGQRAKFFEEVHRDWIIPDIKREILKGQEFLATLSGDEMVWVADQLAECYASKEVTKDVLKYGFPKRDIKAIKDEYKRRVLKEGNKRMLKILKGEFEDVEIKIGIDIAGKQKNLANMSDKVLAIFQAVFANPQQFLATMKIPGMAKAFQDILEFSGISQVDFAELTAMSGEEIMPPQMPGMEGQAPQGMPQAPMMPQQQQPTYA